MTGPVSSPAQVDFLTVLNGTAHFSTTAEDQAQIDPSKRDRQAAGCKFSWRGTSPQQ